MPGLRWLLEPLKALLTRGRMDGEMEEEFSFHLEMEIKKNLGKGMGAAEARRQALIAFGGVGRFEEKTREDIEGKEGWAVYYVDEGFGSALKLIDSALLTIERGWP